ncbi:MAG TPA: hypothetical protein VNT31_12550 [Nocardioides sp.]|nr:hypothetical protein [Nocardioides sp.]
MGARRLTAIAGVATALVLLSGCGGDDASADDPATTNGSASTPATDDASTAAASSTPAPAGTPECADVWQADATLPRAYRGCALDGLLVAPDRLGCSSGQALVRYDDRYWAVAGGPIAATEGPLLDDQAYADAVETCRG